VTRFAAWLTVFLLLPLQALAQGYRIETRELDLDPDPEITEGINSLLKNGAVRYLIYVAAVCTVYYGGRFIWRRLFPKKKKED
jgi:hypothetical protein